MESRMSNQMSYEKREEHGWTVWSIFGSLDINTSPEAAKEGQKIYAAADRMAIDLSGLRYLSSAGLRILMHFGKQANKDGKGFALVAPEGLVATVLKESRMDMIVSVLPSCEELAAASPAEEPLPSRETS